MKAGRSSLADLTGGGRNVLGIDALNQLFAQRGITDWQGDLGVRESGEAMGDGRPTAAALQAFDGYQFDWQDTGGANTGTLKAYDPAGAEYWRHGQQDTTGTESFMDWAKLAAVGFGGAGLIGLGPMAGLLGGAGGALGGAEAGAGAFEGIGGAMASGGAPMTAAQFSAGVGAAGAGIAPMTAAELAVSAAPYVNTLTPQVMAAGIPDIAGMALTGGAASSMFANEGAAQLGQFSTANPVTQAAVNSAALGPTGNLLGGAAAVTPTTFDALRAAEKANMGQVAGNVPSGVDLGSLGGVMQTAPGINPTTFEELRAAEHADMGQAAGNVPKTVNMGDLGGTTGTAGGLQGAIDVAKQVGGDALSSVAGPAGDMASWMKSNPALGRLVMSGAMGLLSGAGGSSGGGSGGPKTYGPAQKWTSPIQRGLLSDPQQMNPAAITQRSPQGLLAQGQQYDGAWRYMGGK